VKWAGLDVGRHHDRTALIVLDELTICDALLIQGLPFDRQRVALDDRLWLHKPRLVAVDVTGIGTGMADLLDLSGWRIHRANIGSGDAAHLELFAGLRQALADPAFHVKQSLPHKAELLAELKALAGTYTPSGRVHVAASSGHDDLGFALALAVLARTRGLKSSG